MFRLLGLSAFVLEIGDSYYEAFESGLYGQANLDLGVGAAGLFTPVFAPIYAIPGGMYFILSTNYPGGQAAYNAAFSDSLNGATGWIY